MGRIPAPPEAVLILGAAVIDDILGLIILAVVVGIVTTGEFRVSLGCFSSRATALCTGVSGYSAPSITIRIS